MESTEKDIFNVLDEFIAAVEETKQVLQSPCVPGRIESCCLCDCAPRSRRKMNAVVQGHCECELLQSRLTRSENELHRYDNKYDPTLFKNQHTSCEKEAEGLVTEMNSLLNQIATAAISLKKIYSRRSAPLLQDIWWPVSGSVLQTWSPSGNASCVNRHLTISWGLEAVRKWTASRGPVCCFRIGWNRGLCFKK